MQTLRLYYEDPNKKSFTARVTGCEQTQKGYRITLDQTAFYPEGGGQPCDLGTLSGVKVLDVREEKDTVVHLCPEPLEVGRSVIGLLNWDRRLDLMQQHTGEHIVSGVIHQMYGAHNVGFHMGSDVITIDFDVMIPAEDFPLIEERVNRAIFENLPVSCTYPDPEALKTIPYRSKKELPWPVRIVQIPGYDICACCGVHVAYTGQIGIIKLLSCVKFHQGVRIEMVCGGRALALLSRIYDQNRLVSQAFSAKLLETGAAAEKMNEQLSQLKYKAASLEQRYLGQLAKAFSGLGDTLCLAPELEAAQARPFADKLAQACGGIGGVLVGSGPRYQLCLVTPQGDLRPLGKELTGNLGAKGGGKADAFQGVITASKEDIRAFFEEKGFLVEALS